MGINNGLSNLGIGCVCHCETVNEAWEYWYKELAAQAKAGKLQDSRDGEVVGEFINAITIIDDPTRFIVNSPIRKLPMRYAVAELLWYLSGNENLSAIQPFTKAWDRMSDDGKIVNSNYGEKIFKHYGFDQWEYVTKSLRKDTLSRQAVIHIREPKDFVEEPTKDMPCTLTLQFLIRDKKLHLTVNMRSNDIWFGFPYDCFNFCAFQNLMAMELGVEVGTYTHIAASLHLYKRDLKDLQGDKLKDENSKAPVKSL